MCRRAPGPLREAWGVLSRDSSRQDQLSRFEGIGPAVKDPQAYRPQLAERWVAQTRAFATLAQAKDSALALVSSPRP